MTQVVLTEEAAQQIEEALEQLGEWLNAATPSFVEESKSEALATIREQKAELGKQRDWAVAQKCFGAGAAWPEQTVMKKAAYELSKWLSAALDDPKVCEEYKNAINGWYDAAMPFLPTKTGKLHRNVLLQALGGLLAGEYSLDAHSLDMYPSKNDDLQQIYDAIGAVKRELEGMAAPVQQAEQEPVAWIELLREARDNCKASIVEEGISATRKEYRIDLEARLSAALNAAPFRTKDLTVSELDAIIEKHYDDEMDLKAMILDGIAADREKNK